MDAPSSQQLPAGSTTTRRRRWLGRFLVTCVIAAIAGNLAWMTFMRPKNPTTVEKVEQLIRGGLQPGDPLAHVQAFLDAKEIPYSYYDAKKYDLSLHSEVERTGVPVRKIGSAVSAVIRDTARSILFTQDIRIVFVFDRDGTLIRHQVTSVHTGP